MRLAQLVLLVIGTAFTLVMFGAYCALIFELSRKALAGDWGYWLPVIFLSFIAGRVFTDTATLVRKDLHRG